LAREIMSFLREKGRAVIETARKRLMEIIMRTLFGVR
jgi:hypothetical protein